MIKCLMHSNERYKINLCNYLETLITLWDYELSKENVVLCFKLHWFCFCKFLGLVDPPSAFLEGILCFS